MKLKKIGVLFVIAILAVGMLSGCSSSETETGEKTQLNVATELFSDTLDPAVAWDSWFVMRWGAGETLVKFADDFSFEPWLAESWDVAEDNLTWTFKLQEGVKFSNGDAMTATKVVESIEKLYADTAIENGGAGNPQSYFTYSSITADDAANTVTIVTTEPVPDLPGCMAYPWMLITNVDESRDLTTQGPICTGPYVIESMTPDTEVTLVKNENYWDGQVPFETVSILKVAEPSTRTLALQDGSADMALSISAADRETLESEGGYEISVVPGSRTGIATPNLTGQLGNDTLRQAVLMAIDGQTIADVTTNGSYTYGYAVVSSGLDFGYDELTYQFSYDPEAAAKLLDDAGMVDSDGDGIRELDGQNIILDYKVTASRQMNVIGEAQAAQLAEIGIQANVFITESQSDVLKNGTFDLCASNELTTPTGDPAKYMAYWYSKSDTNYSSYSSAEYDAIYEKLIVEFDTEVRKGYITQLQQILLDDAMPVVYGYYNYNLCSTDAITGAYCPTSDFYWVTKDIKAAE
jgi:ABC-type transport system substrate-binding protein